MTAVDQFQALFQSIPLGASVKRFAMAQERPHTEVFEAGERIIAQVGQQTVGWKESRMSRGLAAIKGPTSPTEQAAKPGQIQRSGTMIDVKEHYDLPPEWLYLIQNPDRVGDNAVDNARAQFAEAAENGAERIANTVEFVCSKANEGSVNLATIPNSNELKGTISYPVQALTALADWANNGTKIRSSEINRIKDLYHKASGFKPGEALAGDEIEGYVTGNDEIANFLQGHSPAARALETSFMEGGSVPRLGGLNWRFHNAHYALDATPDTTVEYQNPQIATILPPRAMWRQAFAMAEGHEMVPAGPKFALGQNMEGLFRVVQGFWAYVEIQTNPVLIRLHMGYKFLPIHKVPNAVMAFDVTP